MDSFPTTYFLRVFFDVATRCGGRAGDVTQSSSEANFFVSESFEKLGFFFLSAKSESSVTMVKIFLEYLKRF